MTEKVVLTKEQAEAIEKAITEFGKDRVIDGVLGKWQGELSSLNDLKPSEFARIMYGAGYEVEPEFKIGDWFVYIGKDSEFADDIKKGFTGQVESVHYGFITDGYHRFYNSEIRHATPEEIAEEKERRWWKKHGREPWELKIEDVLVDTDGEIKEVTSANVKTNGTVQYCIDYCAYSLDHIKERFIILVFKENRLDVKTDE